MSRLPQVTTCCDADAFDEVIDVRSPAEYAEDHIPGAINLPVLDDEERARIGTIYVQESSFLARKIGAALVARNAARHLEGHFAGKDGSYKPLIYCWRGGQRSGSLSLILAQVGWRVSVLDGGYRRYRRHLIERLYDADPWVRPTVVTGLTGTGKTALLTALANAGEQVVDLEGLARHKGSLLGSDPSAPQPSQKWFESRLFAVLSRLDPERPVWLESESNKIGDLHVPPMLWKAMRAAPSIEITAPVEARVTAILEDYAHFLTREDELKTLVSTLKAMHGGERIAHWHALIDQGAWRTLVKDLLERHYDPAYRRSIARGGRSVAARHQLTSIDPTTLARLARRLAENKVAA